jgi:hypothetical protein
VRYLIISDFGMVDGVRLTLLQFSQTTTLAKDPPKSTLTNGTSLLSSATSSKAGAWPEAIDWAALSLAIGSKVDLVGEEGAEGAGEGRGEGIGDIPAFEGRFDDLLFFPFWAGSGCRRFKTSFSSISILSNKCLNSSWASCCP